MAEKTQETTVTTQPDPDPVPMTEAEEQEVFDAAADAYEAGVPITATAKEAEEEEKSGEEDTKEEKEATGEKKEKEEVKLETKEKPAEEAVTETVQPTDTEKLQKSLDDTKAWGHEMAQSSAALREEVATLKAAIEAQPKVEPKEPEIEWSTEESAFMSDYPEVKTIAEKLAEKLVKGKTGEQAPEVEKLLARLDEFETRGDQTEYSRMVLGGCVHQGSFIEGHSDGLQVANSPEYKTWLNAQTDRSLFPDKITPEFAHIGIKQISAFKAHVASQATEAARAAQAVEAKEIEKDLSGSLDPAGNKMGGKVDGKTDAEFEKDAFDEADKEHCPG